MKRKVLISFFILVVVSLTLFSCSTSKMNLVKENDGNSEESTISYYSSFMSDEEATKSVEAISKPEAYSESDFLVNEDEYTAVSINLASLSSTYLDGLVNVKDEENKTTITLSDDNYNIILSGESNKGVTIKSSSSFILTLDNTKISSLSASDEQALKIKGSGTCFMVLQGENTLEGCTETETNVIKCDGSLVIMGDGSLNVIANTKHGIVSDDVIVIQSGEVTITLNCLTSAGTGIKSVNGYVQNSGKVTIEGKNMTEGSENKGIKVDGDESESEYGKGKGYILINGGEIYITTSGKAISAGFNPTEDGDISSSLNDPIADVFINNGLINITTLQTPREDTYTNGVSNDDGVSPEGIEGKHSVTINGGKIIIESTDDCINTSTSDSSVTINGGLIYAHSSANDSIDSNGTITINGGVVIALGSNIPEGGIDCDEDSRFAYNGGLLIAMGGTNQLPKADNSTGYSLTTNAFSMNVGGNMESFNPFNGERPELPTSMTGEKPELPPDENFKGQAPFNKNGEDDNALLAPPEGERPEPPQNEEGFEDRMGGFNNNNLGGNTIAILDSSMNVILAFTVPKDCVTNSILIASSDFKAGSTLYYTSSAKVENVSNIFASVLNMGNVELSIESLNEVTISDKITTISF